MKLIDKVTKIYNNYNKWESFKIPEGYKSFYDYVAQSRNDETVKKYFPERGDNYLFKKYENIIPNGWYGFALGSPIHSDWVEFLDKVLEMLRDSDPTFRIQQIKIKYGGVRFNCSSEKIQDLDDIEDFIENNLYDEALIY